MRPSRRQIGLGLLVISAIVFLSLLAAPAGNSYRRGSTFSRAPDGYGAWYAFMEEQGVTIDRWQRPLQDFLDQPQSEDSATLLQVYPDRTAVWIDEATKTWVQRGNTLVVLGVQAPVTGAAFTTWQDSPAGRVRIDTRRRTVRLEPSEKIQLGDREGAIVWQTAIGQGQAIWSTTSFLAANAYQNEPGNYAFLAQLVQQENHSIWVDEYLHGYKTADVIVEEAEIETWVGYLAQTPWLLVLAQAVILLLIIAWAQNRRFGIPLALEPPVVDNSQAYINAMAEVLRKAESHAFVMDVVGQAERLQLQKALGLGTLPVNDQTLSEAWTLKTGRPAADLQPLLSLPRNHPPLSESALKGWIEKLRDIRQQVQKTE